MTQDNLGMAYSDLPTGDRRENLQRAIDCYRQALEVRTREAFPQGWARTTFLLATALKASAAKGDCDKLVHAHELVSTLSSVPELCPAELTTSMICDELKEIVKRADDLDCNLELTKDE